MLSIAFLPKRRLHIAPSAGRWAGGRGQDARHVHIRRIELYQKCYHILGVQESADQNTVRRAYIELVKQVHPDSGTPAASAERFQQVDEAFKTLQEKFAKSRRGIVEDDEEQVFNIKHTAPQHRQYLSFDGVGAGNPFQRQKQYQQARAVKAQEHILSHRLERAQAGERNVMQKGSYFKKHAIKTKCGFERVVEDLIQEAMSKGDFDNLAGTGKPLSSAQTQNPYLDFTTHKLNTILLDNGFTPAWINQQRDIREAIANLKQAIAEERAFFGDYPLNEDEAKEWQQALGKFDAALQQINKSIDRYNLIVPLIDYQLFRLQLQDIGDAILKDPNALKLFKRPKPTPAASESSGREQKSDLLSLLASLF